MLEKSNSLSPAAIMWAWYSRTTGRLGMKGKGTTCEITTPVPAGPSSSASAREPTKLTLKNWPPKPLARACLMKAAQDL